MVAHLKQFESASAQPQNEKTQLPNNNHTQSESGIGGVIWTDLERIPSCWILLRWMSKGEC